MYFFSIIKGAPLKGSKNIKFGIPSHRIYTGKLKIEKCTKDVE
jgi:hypothetical protein